MKDEKLVSRLMVEPDENLDLDAINTRDTFWFEPGQKEEGAAALATESLRLQELQRALWGEHKRAVLVVLQGLDTSGKDGTIRHVFGPVNPQGVRVWSFMKPTAREVAYDYLWRVHRRVPAKGFIGVFNRSHYEDILVPGVQKLEPKKVIEQRIRQVVEFERYLAENDITIVKLFLHISRAEQKERLQSRLDDPNKNWKFDMADLEARARWGDYRAFYEKLLPATSRKHAPWYVIPADRKWVRSAVVTRLMRIILEDMAPQYPDPPAGLDEVVIRD